MLQAPLAWRAHSPSVHRSFLQAKKEFVAWHWVFDARHVMTRQAQTTLPGPGRPSDPYNDRGGGGRGGVDGSEGQAFPCFFLLAAGPPRRVSMHM